MIDRELLEEEIRELSRACKCMGAGHCPPCLKAERLNDQLDKLQAEDDIVRDIVTWLRSGVHTLTTVGMGYAEGIAAAIESREFSRKIR